MGFSKLLKSYGNINVILCVSTTTEPSVLEPWFFSEDMNTVIILWIKKRKYSCICIFKYCSIYWDMFNTFSNFKFCKLSLVLGMKYFLARMTSNHYQKVNWAIFSYYNLKLLLFNKISSKTLMLLDSIFLKCVQNKQSFIFLFAVLKQYLLGWGCKFQDIT